MIRCLTQCKTGYAKDKMGCPTCNCDEEKVACPEVMCMMHCESGSLTCLLGELCYS